MSTSVTDVTLFDHSLRYSRRGSNRHKEQLAPFLQMSVEIASKTRRILNSPELDALLEVQAMKIRWKIDLAISGAFLVGLGLAGVGAYTILTKNALEDSLQNARIMIEGASAIRTYTAD